MKKIMGLGAMLLAGLLVIPGNLGLAGQVLAQSDSTTTEDKQLQDLRQKRQETMAGARTGGETTAKYRQAPARRRQAPAGCRQAPESRRTEPAGTR